MPKPKKEKKKKGKKKRGRFPAPVLILMPVIAILLGILYLNWEEENGKTFSSARPASFGQPDPAPPSGASGVNVSKVLLTPFPLLSENDVTARVEGVPSDSGSYQWERNGITIPFAYSETLSKDQYKKGDRIRATFLIKEGKERISSDEVRVENTPPKIIHAEIEPAHPTRRSLLSVKLEATDPDSDPLTFNYRWFKEDGTTVGVGAAMPANLFMRKEKANVEVIPSDGEAKGKGVVATAMITGSPPKITSIPASFSGKEYLYQVTVENPDQEPLVFTLEKSPTGMTIDSKTGLIKWNFTERDAGTHRIEIRVSDSGEGSGTQSFDLPLSFSSSQVSSLSGMEGRIEDR